MLTQRAETTNAHHSTANLHPLIAGRWSPRAFDPKHALDDTSLRNMLEAARCSPSNRNSQPWRFLVGRRGDEVFAGLLDALTPSNRLWAASASALICGLAERYDKDSGERLRWAPYDLGQAIAYLTIQALSDGLYVRQMAGFHPVLLRRRFAVSTDLDPWIVVAVGALGDPESLPGRWRAEEGTSRVRLDLSRLVTFSASDPSSGRPADGDPGRER